MAEGVQVASCNQKYYCHQCSREVSPFCPAELICPDCSTGFLEEVSKDLYEAENICLNYDDTEYESEPDADEDLSLLRGMGMDSILGQYLLNNIAEPDFPGLETESLGERFFPQSAVNGLLQRLGNLDSSRNADLIGLDYFEDFSGDDELDAIASQLLDEVDISGPPPLSKEQIKALPIVVLSKEEVEKGMQCTVCMDDFHVKEKAKSLPCNHLFHEKCIVPWLEKQSTCPNCREVVDVPSRNKRSRSCPRTSRTSRHGRGISESRRYSEAPSLNEYFTSTGNPFRFLH